MTTPRPLLVIVDDEQGILDVVSRFAERAGFDVAACADGRAAISLIQSRRPDLVMVDLRMPEVGGLDILRAIRDVDAHCQAVLMTGYASVDTAVEAVKLGAMDYLTKPLDFGRLDQLLAGVRDEIDRRHSVLSMESDLARRLEFYGMIGRGPRMQDLFGMIRRLSPHVRLALVTGETGTGKELVARALHAHRPAPRSPVHRGQLFRGQRHALRERALRPRARRVPRRDRQQARPLRACRRRHALPRRDWRLAADVRRPSCCACSSSARSAASARSNPRRVDVHVIAATNRDLRAEVAAGRFRGDLFYRLNVVEVKLPPLRDRREDIPYLTAAFVREVGERLQKPLQWADAWRGSAADRVVVGRQRPRAAQRRRARVHPDRR